MYKIRKKMVVIVNSAGERERKRTRERLQLLKQNRLVS